MSSLPIKSWCDLSHSLTRKTKGCATPLSAFHRKKANIKQKQNRKIITRHHTEIKIIIRLWSKRKKSRVYKQLRAKMSKFILRNASQVNQSKSVSQSQGVYAMINSKTRDCSTYCTNAKYITTRSAIICGMRPFSF